MRSAARCHGMAPENHAQSYAALPEPRNEKGEIRRVGVEVEFSGLTEREAAKAFAAACGATAHQKSEDAWICKTERFGDCAIYLDSRWASKVSRKVGPKRLAVLRGLVPVELVTEPILPLDLPKLDAALDALRQAGATGSRDGLTKGFGVHLNIEIAAGDVAGLARVLTAYALLEEMVRADAEIDISRRILPFVDPYPAGLPDALAGKLPASTAELALTYLDHTTSRNHGLDMLPILAELEPGAVHGALGPDSAVSARPAYHFRLPDCRIDEPGWTLRPDWERWRLVEQVAASDDALGALRSARRDWARRNPLVRPEWQTLARDIVATYLKEAVA